MRLCFGTCRLPTFLSEFGSPTGSVDTWFGSSSLELLESEWKLSEQLWLIMRYVEIGLIFRLPATHLELEARVDTRVAP